MRKSSSELSFNKFTNPISFSNPITNPLSDTFDFARKPNLSRDIEEIEDLANLVMGNPDNLAAYRERPDTNKDISDLAIIRIATSKLKTKLKPYLGGNLDDIGERSKELTLEALSDRSLTLKQKERLLSLGSNQLKANFANCKGIK